MATDLRLTYADIDQELFDVDQIPVTTRDVRSVGEMLVDVDYLARQLLMDVRGDDAGTLLRSWPPLVEAAEDLWTSLPGRRPGVDERDRPMTSFSAQAATIESSLSRTRAWPGQGPTNPRVDQMIHTLLNAAARLIAGASMVLVDAAATAGILEPSDRLISAITEAGRSWSHLASRWGDLAPPSGRLEEPLARAAAEVRAAYRQITHDTTALATPQVIATRPELAQATVATLRAIGAGSELAHVVAEKVDTPHLIGPARAMSRRAHNDVEAGLANPSTEGDVVWVSPTDILARRAVTVPRPVR